MMDELKQQFYEVMHKYQKPFSEEGVAANLTQWYEQKQGLLQLLRRHPLWNEKELAIVFRVEERRKIDRATVDETRAAILELGRMNYSLLDRYLLTFTLRDDGSSRFTIVRIYSPCKKNL